MGKPSAAASFPVAAAAVRVGTRGGDQRQAGEAARAPGAVAASLRIALLNARIHIT